jgi:hypothetical protein
LFQKSAWPLFSRTLKHAARSSIDQGGGKRREASDRPPALTLHERVARKFVDFKQRGIEEALSRGTGDPDRASKAQ